jgi:uncharacterized membrane protein YedE/YeeE
VLIGLGACALLLFDGRIAGISGIVGSMTRATAGDRAWRVLFLAGLVAGGALTALFVPGAIDPVTDRPLVAVAVAGLLVGIGTRLGMGCTSGHGVCGLGLLSVRSLVATCVFMATGAVTVYAFRVFFSGHPGAL